VAVKQRVLLMLESVARGIDRLEAVTKQLDPEAVEALLAKLQVLLFLTIVLPIPN
jgi:hypothetical protein